MVILARREEKAASPYLARRPGSGLPPQAAALRTRGQGVRAVPGPGAEKSWAAAGLPPSAGARVPAAPVQSAARSSLSAPGGGALEIRFALPTRPLSGAKARGWVLDLDLQVRTVSGSLMETYFKSCWDQKMYSWEAAGKIKATQRLKGQALSEAEWGGWGGGGIGGLGALPPWACEQGPWGHLGEPP